jgi:hypothetical protein
MATRNLTPAERDQIFGPLEVTATFGRDGVRFREDPPLVGVQFGPHTVRVHEAAARSLAAVAADLEAAGLLGRVREILGFQPRMVRTASGGNTPNLSAHAYGAAVDVNFSTEPHGERASDAQGELAAVFEPHGWFWGDRFETPDPHHFTFQGFDPLLASDEQLTREPDPLEQLPPRNVRVKPRPSRSVWPLLVGVPLAIGVVVWAWRPARG